VGGVRRPALDTGDPPRIDAPVIDPYRSRGWVFPRCLSWTHRRKHGPTQALVRPGRRDGPPRDPTVRAGGAVERREVAASPGVPRPGRMPSLPATGRARPGPPVLPAAHHVGALPARL